jgi:competence protein ComEC
VPLVTLAYLAVAAGLLMGFGGAVLPGAACAIALVAAGVQRRQATASVLGVLLLAAVALAHFSGKADERCARAIAAGGVARVRLGEDVRPRRNARGVALGAGCRVPVRVGVDSGHAVAGALVDVHGEGRRDGGMVTFSGARIAVRAQPGVLAKWRAHTGRTIDEIYGAQAPLARALLIADEHDIAPEVRRQFADAGIIHMLSVSGLHVGILAEAVALAALLLGAGVRRAELAAVVVTACFVLFVGAPAPAVRAGAMYAAVVAARRLQRPTSPWALLALGAAVPLLDPRAVLEVGYQLSSVGMAGLVASGALLRRLSFPKAPAWTLRAMREMLATVVASAVTAPIVAWHFGRVSLAAPVTNLAAAPLFGLAQPALFVSLLCFPVRPVARFVAGGTGVLLAAISRVAAWGASVPGAALDVMPSAFTAALMAVAAGALIATCAARRWARPALAGIGAVATALWWPLVAPSGTRLEVHMIDVGQGDAIALRTPVGRWIVVDAGDAWRNGDAGARIVAPYLRRRGGDVAALVLTHPHSDHIGGAASLLRLTSVAAVYDGGVVYSSEVYDSLLSSTRAAHVAWRLARTGDTLTIDGVHLRILGPDSITAARARDPNEASVVVMAEYRGARVLLTGDAERDEESRILDRFGDEIRADVLKVGHHGSITSSTPPFLDAVHPRVALVSVGADNGYGHPSAQVMHELQRRQVELLRTDQDGTVVVSTDGITLRIRTDEASWELRIRSAP